MPGTAEGIRKARATLARVRAERADRARLVREGGPTPDIVTFATDPQWLGLSLSLPQRTLLKAAYGLALDPEELEVFTACTGRTKDPQQVFRNLTVIAGARGGKDSRLVAPVVLFEALFGGHVVSKGEVARIALVAQDQDAAKTTFDYVKEYALASPRIKGQLAAAPLANRLTLLNGVEVRVFPCTSKAARSYSFITSVMNEAAFYRFHSTSANQDVEVEASLRRGAVAFPNAKTLKVSTPYAKAGVMHRDYLAFYGRDDALDVLVWKAASVVMNPSIMRDRLAEEERLLDPERYQREFEAEFTDAASAWLPGDLIEAAVDAGVRERPPMPGVKYVMALDPSGGGRCGFAMSIAHEEKRGTVRVFVQDLARVWMKPASGALDLAGIVQEVVEVGRRYGCTAAFSDQYAGVWPAQRFQDAGFDLKDPVVTRRGERIYLHKSDAFYESAPLFRTGAIRLLDIAGQTRELRNLEARPLEGGRMRIGKPAARGEMDDQANAVCLGMAALASVAPGWGSLPAWSHTETTAERAAKFLGSQPRTNDQIHPHERVEPVGRPEMSERKGRAWEHQPDLPDTRERGVACADPRCGLRWAAAPRDYEATFERHWRDVGSRHAGRPLPPVGQRYTIVDPQEKPSTSPKATPALILPVIDGWTITASTFEPERRIVYQCDACGVNGNLLRANLDEFVARHMKERHAA